MRRTRIIVFAALAAALLVVPAAWALKIAKTQPPTGYVGASYYFDFQPEDGQGCSPYSWSVDSGSFPPGLSISSDDGIVTGTPTQVGSFTFYLELKSCAGNTTQSQFTINIEQKLTIATNSPLPDGGINQPYGPVQLTATGGTVSAWSIQSGSLPAGITLTSAGVIAGTPTQAGTFEIVAFARTSDGKSDTKRIRLTITAPLVLGGPGGTPPASEPVARNGKIGSTLSWAVQATGGSSPYTYSAIGTLPEGITLATDGKVTGTYEEAGVFDVTFRVTDAKGATDDLKVRFNVKALLAFGTGTPKAGKVGKAYSWRVPTTGASATKTFLASGSFPPGLSLNEATGVFSGKALAAGTYTVKVWVLGDSGTQISKTYKFKISK